MRMGQGVRAGLGHGEVTCVCVLQTQFSSLNKKCWHIEIHVLTVEILTKH